MSTEPLERILVPLDHSPVSPRLVEFAKGVATAYGSEIVLFSAIDASIIEHPAAGFDPNAIINELESKYREMLEEYANSLRAAGVRVVVHEDIPVTDPCIGIVTAARKEGVSEILIATKGWGLRRLVPVGGTARTVVKLSTVPVIAVRAIREGEEVKILGNPRFAHRIAVGVSEDISDDMLAYIASLVRKAGTETLYLIHIIERMSDREASAFLDKVQEKLGDVGAEIMKVVLTGKPARVLASFASPPTATGLIVGRSIKREFPYFLLGSTVDRILQEAIVPTIVYPLGGEESGGL